jgi:lysozyme family protein
MNNLDRWKAMHIPAAKGPAFEAAANKIKANKSRYQAVEKLTGVPWQVIGVIHLRESNCDFATYLGNGQSLNRKTTIVPKGRGPFSNWEDGAVDALKNAPPKAALNKDWSIGGTLDKLEEYNGLGYRSMGVPSPYLWAGTDQYVKGKYVADHKYDPDFVDPQLGCAGVLKFLGYLSSGLPTATIAGATVAGGTVVAGAHANGLWPTFEAFVHNHWLIILVGVVGAGILIDLAIALYKNGKANVSNNR